MSFAQLDKLSEDILKKKLTSLQTQIKNLNNDFVVIDFNNLSKTDIINLCIQFTDMLKILKENIALKKTIECKDDTQLDDDCINNDINDLLLYDGNASIKKPQPIKDDLDVIKRLFFNRNDIEFLREYDNKNYIELIDTSFIFYRGVYKFNDYMVGKPDYVIKNFNKSFIKRFESLSDKLSTNVNNFLFGVFKCYNNADSCDFVFYILINSYDILNFIHNEFDDIDFTTIDNVEFLNNILDNGDSYDLKYLH